MRRSGATPILRAAAPTAPTGRSASAAPRLAATIALPGVEGRIDHLALDVAQRRLFVAARGNNSVEVVDLRAQRRVGSIAGLLEPQGIVVAPELGRLFVTNGGSGDCDIFDGQTLKRSGRVEIGPDADNMRYDAARKVVYVACGDGELRIFGAEDGKARGEIALAGHPESFQLEMTGQRIFANVPASNHIAVIDRERREVTAKWFAAGAAANYPMALDEAHHRLFVGYREPARVMVFDTATGRVASSLDIAGDTDDLFWDGKRQCLYAICGAGFIDVFRANAAGGFDTLPPVATGAGARTGLLAPELDQLFVAVPHRGSQAAQIRVYTLPRT